MLCGRSNRTVLEDTTISSLSGGADSILPMVRDEYDDVQSHRHSTSPRRYDTCAASKIGCAVSNVRHAALVAEEAIW